MKAFLLTPVPENLTHHNWRASTCRVACITIAENEGQAIDQAVQSFVIAVEKSPGAETAIPPWRVPDLVTCEQIELDEGEFVLGDVITANGELHRDGDFLRRAEWPI